MLRREPVWKPLTREEEGAAYDAAQVVVEAHRRLSAWLRIGITLTAVDEFVARTLEDLNCTSCFYRYKLTGLPEFPSHACLSVNSCVVHGTPDTHTAPLKPGDLLKIDVGVVRDGWIGDAARTYVFGEMTSEILRLTDCGKESLRRGITKLKPGNPLVDWARAVQNHVEREKKYFLVAGLGGHGYGKTLHTDPYISNTVPTKKQDWPHAYMCLRAGMLLAVEPMIAAGTGKTVQSDGEWPVYSADGSQSVHYEHDILITGKGPRILTEGLDEVPDVVSR